MGRLKANPGAALLLVGGLLAIISTFFVWVSITNASGDTASTAAIKSTTGQTLFLLGIVAAVSGVGVLAATGGGRIVWALLGLLCIGLVFAAGLIGLFSPETLGQRFATAQSLSSAGFGSPADTQEAVKQGFASGAMTASIAFGAILGLIAGALGTAGAVISLFRKQDVRPDVF